MKVNRMVITSLILMGLIACKKYESFTKDFDHSVVYFATQKALRTIVAYDTMQFKVGVALAGVRENKKGETVTFEIDPSLLETVPGAAGFQLLPEAYYTLSNKNTMVISPGKLIGDITVTLNKARFTNDSEASNDYYALPLRIVSSSTDSVLKGDASVASKDYTIIVVKYISPYSGNFYHKGVETQENSNHSTVYSKPDLASNQIWNVATVNVNEVLTAGVGTHSAAKLRLINDGKNNISVLPGVNVTAASGDGTFDPRKGIFYLRYTYTMDGISYDVKDTLIRRLPPEQDLRFEEWQPITSVTPAHVLTDYDLFWNDEFNGSTLDLTKWEYRMDGVTRNLGTVSRANSVVNGNGQLVISVTRGMDGSYKIGQVGTQGLFETTYGYFECRAKMNSGLGPHVAFWLQSPTYGGLNNPAVDGAEVDIFEYHRRLPNIVHHNIHWNGYGVEHQQLGKQYTAPQIASGYHTFGLEWTNAEYIFYVDGIETWRTPISLSKRSQFMILSAELTGWGGDPALGNFPDAVYFDYVRVYKKK